MENLQVENGNFTRIVNKLLESIARLPYRGCEVNIILFLIRKTYGFNKTEDDISLRKFCEGVNRERPNVVKALNTLIKANIVIQVKKGDKNGSCSTWKLNKYVEKWVVTKSYLVTQNDKPSNDIVQNLVTKSLHTKEIKESKEIYIMQESKESRFEEFWKLYPKKVGKQKALSLWKLLTSEDKSAALADIPLRHADKKWIEGFIKDPERYIKYRQWEDEIIKPKATSYQNTNSSDMVAKLKAKTIKA